MLLDEIKVASKSATQPPRSARWPVSVKSYFWRRVFGEVAGLAFCIVIFRESSLTLAKRQWYIAGVVWNLPGVEGEL